MKIALTTYQFQDIGGIPRFILELAGELTARGHEVAVITFARGSGWEQLADAGLSGVCLEHGRGESVFHHAVRAARYLEHEAFEAVINNIGVRNVAGQRCLRFLPEHIARLVVLHGTKPGVFELAAVNQHICDAYVAVSPHIQALATAYLPARRVVYIPNGIRRPQGDPANQRRDWSSPLRLLFVGRLENKAKNIVLLPEIVAACRREGVPVALTVVGDGRDRPQLEQAIGRSGVGQLIDLRGSQPPEAVYQAMQAHHILLLPSNHEGLPLVLLEAQINGCVPVASRLAGATDIAVEAGVTGLLAPPGDAAAFARQIAALADPDRWRAFSRAAMTKARAEFTKDMMGDRYARLLQELTADRAALTRLRGRPDSLCNLFAWHDFLPATLQRRLTRRKR